MGIQRHSNYSSRNDLNIRRISSQYLVMSNKNLFYNFKQYFKIQFGTQIDLDFKPVIL